MILTLLFPVEICYDMQDFYTRTGKGDTPWEDIGFSLCCWRCLFF